MKPKAAHASHRPMHHPGWRVAVLLVAAGVAPAWAQSGPGLRFSTSIDGGLSTLVNSRQGGRDSPDVVVDVRPGFSISSRAGRVVGSLSYAMLLSQRSRNSESEDSVSHNLSSQFSAVAIDRLMYVDGSASISQQLKDPHGARSASNSSAGSNNRLEVASASLSPRLEGRLGGGVTYELRLNAGANNARNSIENDSSTWGGALNVASQVGVMGWGLVVSSQESDFRATRSTRNDRAYASLSWLPDPDLSLSVRGGEESTDVGAAEQQRSTTYGGNVTWRPSTRTRLQVDAEKRHFGDSYRVTLDHRMSNFSVAAASSRSDSSASYGTRGAITALQLREAILSATITDPLLRRQQALAYLQAVGIDPDLIVVPASLSSSVSVLESHTLTLGYAGRKLSLGLQAFRSSTRGIDTDFLTPVQREPLEQQGWTATLGYQLSPNVSFDLTGGRQDTRATATRGATNLKNLSATLGMKLARNASASLGARYSVFNSSTEPYREAAITAAAGYRF